MILYLDYYSTKIPVRVSYSVTTSVKEKTGVDITNAEEMKKSSEEAGLTIYEDILSAALESGHRGEQKMKPDSEKKPYPFTDKEDILDILDECFMQFVALIPQFFPNEELMEKQTGNRQQKRAQKKTTVRPKA